MKQHKTARKSKAILIRVTEAQKRALTVAAKHLGLGLSSWVRSAALHAARKLKPSRRRVVAGSG